MVEIVAEHDFRLHFTKSGLMGRRVSLSSPFGLADDVSENFMGEDTFLGQDTREELLSFFDRSTRETPFCLTNVVNEI